MRCCVRKQLAITLCTSFIKLGQHSVWSVPHDLYDERSGLVCCNPCIFLLLFLLRFSAMSRVFTISGEIFACVTVFNLTIEVVTFRLRGWCMLGVFLLPAFTRLGHECQNLLSPCDGMHVCTDQTSVYTLIRKSCGGMESEPMLPPREKNPFYRK